MIVDELIAILGFDVRGEGELRKFNQGLDRAEGKARGFSSAMLAIGGAVAGAFAGLAIGRQVGNFVGSIAQVGAEFEKYQATLTTIEGSSEKAAAAMDWISDFAATTPYEVSELTEAFVRMRAYGLDPMDGSFKAIGDASAAMGKGFMQGVEAIADAVVGENERLKELGIRASVEGDQITYAWTQDGIDRTRTVRKNATEIQAALMEIFGRFDGAMLSLNKTWDGMTSNMADRWTGFLRAIGDAGYYDDIKRRLQTTLDFVNRAFESGLAEDIAKRISNALTGTLDIATHLATQAYRIGRGFFAAADGVLDLTSRVTGLSKSMAAIGMGAGLLASSAMGRGAMMAIARRVPFVAAALVLDDILSGLNGDDSLIGSTAEGAAALERLKKSFADLQAAGQDFADSLGIVREAIVTSLSLPPDAFSSIEDVKTRWEALREDMSAGWKIGDIEFDAEPVFDRIETWAEGAAERFRLLFTDPIGLMMNLAVDSIERVSSAVETLATGISLVGDVLKNPEAAWERFVNAAIAQIDRLLAAIDQKLGGALTRFGFIGEEPEPAENPNQNTFRTTGQPAREARTPLAYTDDALDAKFRHQNAEGRRIDPIVIEVNEAQVQEAVAKIGAAADWLAEKLGGTADAILGTSAPRPTAVDVTRTALRPEALEPDPSSGKSARVRQAPSPQPQSSSGGLAQMVQSAIEQVSAKVDGVRETVQNYLADARVQSAFAVTDGGTSEINAAQMAQGLENLRAQMQAMRAKEVSQSIQSTITNQDQRQFPVSVSAPVSITQHIQQASQAPAAAARATGAAVSSAVSSAAPARIQGSASAP